jgi:carboxyl-terminal processing protease
MAPGSVKPFSFEYEVGQDFRGDSYELELMVGDTVLGESVTDKIHIKVAGPGAPIAPDTGIVTVSKADIVLREAPSDTALVVARAPKGTVFKTTGKVGAFARIEIEASRPAFISMGDAVAGGAVAAKGEFRPEWHVTPPVLTVHAPTVASGGSVRVRGMASDDHQIKDVYIRVYNRDSKLPPKKVYYQSNHTGDRTKLPFEADVPLWPGSNLLQVFARETNEIQSVTTLVVLHRGAPSLVQQREGMSGDRSTRDLAAPKR